jgi:small GTP-binding protein
MAGAGGLSRQTLAKLQSQPERIRNMCILAHVDHGKTTLSDSLLSSNGIISSKLAGRVRYLDSTEEEQARGITMKASAIALVHNDEPHRELRKKVASAPESPTPRLPYLINLIDSPGHVDFSMDVAAAARLCDGALVIVDAVEGVCIQTHAVLRTSYAEGVRPALVLNKVDRLILELRLSPEEAYAHLSRIIEAANVVMSSLYTADLMAAKSTVVEGESAYPQPATTPFVSEEGGAVTMATDGWAIEVDEGVESNLFFDPARGNVVFASAYDGWAFSVDDFARLHSERLGVGRGALRRALWGGYTYKAKAKKVVALSGEESGKPCAVSLMMEPLWAVYDCCVLNPNEERQGKIVKSLGLGEKLGTNAGKRDMASREGSVRACAILRAWLPLSEAVLSMAVRVLPSPKEAQAKRLAKLWPEGSGAADVPAAALQLAPRMALSDRLARVRAAIAACDPSESSEVVVFVSKMFAVPTASLPDPQGAYVGESEDSLHTAFPTAPLPLPPSTWYGLESMPLHGGAAVSLRPVAATLRRMGMGSVGGQVQEVQGEGGPPSSSGAPLVATLIAAAEEARSATGAAAADDGSSADESFIAFARVFSGVLRPDSPVFVLGPRYDARDPCASGGASLSVPSTPLPLYLMMGRDLSPIPAAYAGNVVGIGRLGAHVLKTATLASTPACASLSPMTFQTTPLVRVAIEPVRPTDLAALERGLALLDAADPCVEVTVTDGGELQLAALGELHLQRCVTDLRTRFARVEIAISPPILAFQETCAAPPRPLALPTAVAAALIAQARSSPSVTSESGEGGGVRWADAPEATAKLDPLLVPFPLFGQGKGPGSLLACWCEPPETWGGSPVLHLPSGTVLASTPDRALSLRLTARPLPNTITRILEEGAPALRALVAIAKRGGTGGPGGVPPSLTSLLERLRLAASEAGGEWPAVLASALAFGPREAGCSFLAFRADSTSLLRDLGEGEGAGAGALPSVWAQAGLLDGLTGVPAPPKPALSPRVTEVLRTLRSALVQGFGLAAGAGPLAGEPLWGVCISVEAFSLARPTPPSSGALMSLTRDAARTAVEAAAPRLVEAFYACEIACSGGRGGGGEALRKCNGLL